jgi:hypothetical protein
MSGLDIPAALRRGAVTFAIITAMGALVGLLGPFGSFLNGPAWQRIVYWVLMAWLGLPAYVGLRLVLDRTTSRRAGWIAVIASAALFSAASAWVSWTVAHSIWPRLNRVSQLTPAVWYGEGLVVTAVFTLVLWRRWSPQAETRSPAAAPDLLGAPSSQILCLQMEDHYVRVHTAAGSRLVLATLSQAMETLGRTPGLRVHRSWWVAERAVAGAVADGRNLRLVLVNGLTAPIARASVAAVREAGWLERQQPAASPSADASATQPR